MFTGESKKRPTVSLRGKSKEEDRAEFLRRARAQRQERAQERLHVSSATTIQRVWRGRSCVGKWRERERGEWDKKLHDVGRVQTMLAAKGQTFQVPSSVLQNLLSQLVNFHVFPRDAERFRTALGLVLSAAGDARADPWTTGIFAPLATAAAASSGNPREDVIRGMKVSTTMLSDAWGLLVARLGILCLNYIAEFAEAIGGMSGAGRGVTRGSAGTDSMEDDESDALVGGGNAVRGASDSAAQVFALLSSPGEWQRRGLLETKEAELLCRSFLASLAVGRPGVLRDATGVGGAKGDGKGVRLLVKLERGAVDGKWVKTPRLFSVLRMLWDAAAEGGAIDADRAGALRLLCTASLEALGIPSEGAGRAEASAHALERKILFETFAAAILPAPRLLEHPYKALLVDPILAGEARAWWELVSVAGDAVGGKGACLGGGGAATRRDVAWTVANVLNVDTGAGGTTAGAGAEHAHSLVRALCRLLRKVSLHALLQGAGRPAGGDGGGGVQVDSPSELEDDDDESMEIEDIMSGAAAGRSSGTSGTGDDYAGEGVRLEAIVRFHRRRCALRTEDPVTPQQKISFTAGKGRGRAGDGEGKIAAFALGCSRRVEEAGGDEVEAMAAAAGRLASPAVVGKLFDSILPPADLVASSGEQKSVDRGHDTIVEPPSGHLRYGDSIEESDPVLALCILYADLVVDGVRAGPAAAAASGAVGLEGSGKTTTPGKSVLNALAFGRPRAPIAARLWAYLKRCGGLATHADGSSRAGGGIGGEGKGVVGTGERGGMQSALFLFCSACSHQLLALDDEEFYVKQRPLTLVEVRQLVDFLKKWLCRLYWVDPVIPRLLDDHLPSDASAAARLCEDRLREALLLLSATRLFNQLYERNTRRSFLAAEEWFWRAISAKELSPPDRGDSRFDFFSRGNLGMVLTNIPQVIPFFQRVSIFRQMIDAERHEHQNNSAFTQSSARIRVSRETLYEDSAETLTKLGSGLKGRIQVTLLNQHGVEEAGIDGGGVFKEYMDLLTKRAFDPQYALFIATEDQYLFPNPAASMVAEDYLFHFEFLGRVLGKAVFEDILVEPQFSPVFLNKLLGRHNYIDDLYSLDPELYRNLMQLKAIVQKGGDVEDLCLTFSATTTAFGDTKVWDLISGGRDVAVTNASVISYIHLMAHFKLNGQTARPCKAFLQGFRDLIPVEWIRLFNPHELQRLIGGEGGQAIDVADLKRNTRYGGGYHESQPVMKWFWEAIVSFTPEEQARFLKFVTSCSRPPLLGFERLNPPICVQKVPNGENGRLPSSATCMNLLKLPHYADKQTLRDKLLYAISSNAGFELT